MSFLYPFTVSVQRVAYSFVSGEGAAQSSTTIISSTQASIQLKRDKGASQPVGFGSPTNTSSPLPYWIVFIPVSVGSMTVIQDGDMVTDLGQTTRVFKVDAAEYTELGWALYCSPYKPDA